MTPYVRTWRLGGTGDRTADPLSRLFTVVGVALAFTMGVSPLFEGFYDFAVWGGLALVLASLLVACVWVRTPRLTRLAWLALAGMTLLAAWSAASMLWADSTDRAWAEANRAGLYALILALGFTVIRTPKQAAAALAGLAGGLMLTVGITLGGLFTSSASERFVDFRLSDPLGYVNGLAGSLLLAFWAFVAFAERRRGSLGPCVAAAFATATACLLVLTQSRAFLPALAVSGAVVLLAIRGRAERVCLLGMVAVATALAAPWLLEVYDQRGSGGGLPSLATVRSAGIATVVMSGLAGVAWGVACRLAGAIGPARARRLAVGGAAAIIAVGLIGVVVERPISRIERAYDEFVTLADEPVDRPRFGSGGGWRYDMWRVALVEFQNDPLRGVGAGNFASRYYQERRTLQEARQPHSLELQLLAEVGLLGVLAMALTVVCLLAGQFRNGMVSASAEVRWPSVATLGIFVAWLTHTSVDWLHILPGVTGVALIAAVAGCTIRRGQPVHGDRREPSRPGIGMVAMVVAVALLVASIGRQYAADWYRRDARDALASGQATLATDRADRALSLNPESLESHYLLAGALARMGDYDGAVIWLRKAAKKESENYLPWALLGDLAVRHGELNLAARRYAIASRLNPLDPTLRTLTRDPRTALDE
jgi:hypothetical protein